VGVAGDHAGKPLGDQAGRFGPGRRVVAGRIGPGADCGLPQRPVHPEQGGHRGHDHDEGDQSPEAEQPPLGMVVQQAADTGQERQQTE
jgi:hypothetical protein